MNQIDTESRTLWAEEHRALFSLPPSHIGKWVKKQRLAEGLSVAALAKHAGLSRQTIYKIESDIKHNPRPQTLEAINKVLDKGSSSESEQSVSIPSSLDQVATKHGWTYPEVKELLGKRLREAPERTEEDWVALRESTERYPTLYE